MSISEDRNSDPTTENMEQEDKVNVEEACVNLSCVKKELDEEELEFEHRQYKITFTFENMFGESSTKQRSNRDSLIGFLDGDVIMETGSVKLEDVKEENKDLIQKTMEQSDCNKCGGNYQGYCVNCSSLSHILNNLTTNLNPEPVLNTTPRNMFEIRELSKGYAVFALKTFPKGIILGPFEGIAPIESTTGLQWKIKHKKLVNDQNGNWMKYIESVAKRLSRNLDIFQFEGILYFETSREIQEGEELLVCYCEEKEEILKSDKEEAFYLVPVKKEEYPKVFACTLCCLGFGLESCLVEHKSKCPQGDHGGSIEDFEIIQCRCCKVWLEKEEYLESHMLHCLENYNRSSRKRNSPTTTDNEELVYENEEITSSIDVNASYSTPPTETINSNKGKGNLDIHLNTHRSIKPFECDICKQRFTEKRRLKLHIKDKHSNTNEKEYKCFTCFYQTNYKSSLKVHLETHMSIKPFECDICKQRFGRKGTLKEHIKNKHSNTNVKDYKCSECSFQTNYKRDLNIHLDTHRSIKPFECDICKQTFGQKGQLKVHIKNKHSNTNEKEYKCFQCSYQTNRKGDLKRHLGIHSNTNEKEYKCSECSYQTNCFKCHLNPHRSIKQFECDICKQRFSQKGSLKVHIQNKHSNTNEKEYKCSECSFATIYKTSLKNHLVSHTGIKDFRCDTCKQRFAQKGHLKVHIKNQHSNTNVTCFNQTNYKSSLKVHLETHMSIKQFECDICKQRFSQKGSLNVHVKNKHSNTSEKEYKCSECSYQTNLKGCLKIHLDAHTGIKHFQCDICKQRFTQKHHLKVHIKNKHSNTNEKEYKCTECCYQTNLKSSLKIHLLTHTGVKDFQCDICKRRFGRKHHLKVHIKNKHLTTNEKDYKCSECSYQTNLKSNLQTHIKNKHSNTNEKEYKCSEHSL